MYCHGMGGLIQGIAPASVPCHETDHKDELGRSYGAIDSLCKRRCPYVRVLVGRRHELLGQDE
ncbi:MAG: hypothetical protein H5T33_05595 [Candidatus Methanosuratus sp.]|nr:hypothetical protein [Candidatus Methanosuratincola sp.]